MNLIQVNAIAKQQQKIEAEQNDNLFQQASPVRSSSIFGALTKPQQSTFEAGDENTPPPTKAALRAKKFKLKVPKTIEDVPFRRQDRRILNARKKRFIDRSLIRFTILCGILLSLFGAALIVLWYFIKEKWAGPFIIIGPVVLGCGLLVALFSVEICIRLRKSKKRVMDKDIDRLKNLHQIKHWIDPALIPYGWGHDKPLESSDDVAEFATDVHGGQDVEFEVTDLEPR